eukprot:485424-Rhodomonas_salina.1
MILAIVMGSESVISESGCTQASVAPATMHLPLNPLWAGQLVDDDDDGGGGGGDCDDDDVDDYDDDDDDDGPGDDGDDGDDDDNIDDDDYDDDDDDDSDDDDDDDDDGDGDGDGDARLTRTCALAPRAGWQGPRCASTSSATPWLWQLDRSQPNHHWQSPSPSHHHDCRRIIGHLHGIMITVGDDRNQSSSSEQKQPGVTAR